MWSGVDIVFTFRDIFETCKKTFVEHLWKNVLGKLKSRNRMKLSQTTFQLKIKYLMRSRGRSGYSFFAFFEKHSRGIPCWLLPLPWTIETARKASLHYYCWGEPFGLSLLQANPTFQKPTFQFLFYIYISTYILRAQLTLGPTYFFFLLHSSLIWDLLARPTPKWLSPPLSPPYWWRVAPKRQSSWTWLFHNLLGLRDKQLFCSENTQSPYFY